MPARKRIRYAVVGLGHIAQAAVLPAFKNAKKNSELAALVSDDPVKRQEISEMYGVERTYGYEQFEECLQSGDVDAVYIALPNHLHRSFTERAARAGVHVLCEKPMAVTEEDCQAMIDAAGEKGVKLMIAYRLHFEEANLKAIELAQSGEIGEPRFFCSEFSMQVKPGDIRVRRETGGGSVYDIGIYCINAARYLFKAEPEEVTAFTAAGDDSRFQEVEEMVGAVLRFPGERLASFTCSFGAADVASYRIIGTKGDLRVESAYEYVGALKHHLTVDGKTKSKSFRARDQFSPELIYFSNCILEDREPEPSGQEGLADVRVIRAIYQSARERRPVRVEELTPVARPTPEQEIHRPAVSEPELVHAESPSD